jgi:hypothetical protein
VKLAERLGKRRATSRGFHTAVMTTFAVDFAGFEQVVLPQLAAAGATNILLVCDERMSAMALSDGSILPQQLGRDYALHGPAQASGVFHPKVVVQLGRDGGRAFVGSANATSAGIGGNLEIVTEVACTNEPSAERDFVCSVWAYVEQVTGAARGAAADAVSWARDRTPWLAGTSAPAIQTLEDGTLLALLTRPGAAEIADRFVDLVGGDHVQRLIVMSPYWDDGLAALNDLAERLQGPPIFVLVDPDAHGLPEPMPPAPNLALVDCSTWRKGRFKHAKLIVAQTAEHDHVLAGSANCTGPALGTRERGGTNAEASVYRRVPHGTALEALDLNALLDGVMLTTSDLQPARRGDPIPLKATYDLRPGRFEAEHGELRWYRPSRPWGGSLILLGADGEELGRIGIEHLSGTGDTQSIRRDDLNEVSFVQIDDEEISTVAPLTHRGLMRSRRREAGTRSVAAAAAKFVDTEDLQLFLLQALDELQRADDETQATAKPRAARAQIGDEKPPEASSEVLTYERFVEQKPEARRASGGESSISGTHTDGVRELLNRLSGAQSFIASEERPAGDDWMDLGDEDQESTLIRDVAEVEATERSPADRNAFVKAVRQYEQAVAGGEGAKAVGGADVLRLRFWLMLLVHAARWRRYREGLPGTVDDFGWPRLVVRILSSFFYGKEAPIVRLVVENAFLDLPIDFLETWATALWLVDLLPEAVGRCHGRDEFLMRIPALRQRMVQRMGLTSEEMDGAVITRVWAGLDRDIGQRLREERQISMPVGVPPAKMSSLKRAKAVAEKRR